MLPVRMWVLCSAVVLLRHTRFMQGVSGFSHDHSNLALQRFFIEPEVCCTTRTGCSDCWHLCSCPAHCMASGWPPVPAASYALHGCCAAPSPCNMVWVRASVACTAQRVVCVCICFCTRPHVHAQATGACVSASVPPDLTAAGCFIRAWCKAMVLCSGCPLHISCDVVSGAVLGHCPDVLSHICITTAADRSAGLAAADCIPAPCSFSSDVCCRPCCAGQTPCRLLAAPVDSGRALSRCWPHCCGLTVFFAYSLVDKMVVCKEQQVTQGLPAP
jgi:hypothetical protein